MDPVPQTCAPTTQPGGVQRDPAVGVVDRDARTAPTPRNTTVPVPVSAGTLSLEHDCAIAVGFALQGGAGGQSSSTGEQRWCRGMLLKHAITHGQERVFLREKIWMSVSKPSKDASVLGGECSGGRTWGLGPATSCWCPRGGGTEQPRQPAEKSPFAPFHRHRPAATRPSLREQLDEEPPAAPADVQQDLRTLEATTQAGKCLFWGVFTFSLMRYHKKRQLK